MRNLQDYACDLVTVQRAFMKLIHTADIQLDRCFADCLMPPGQANWQRQHLRELFLDILRRAQAARAKALLVAGGLFLHERVGRDTVAFLREAFELARPLPVFIAPGSADPLMAGSPYVTEPWPDHVHIFQAPRWEAVPLDDAPLTVHGFAFDGPAISHNPFGELSIPADGRTHVAVGSGAWKQIRPGAQPGEAPFDADNAAVPGLAYLALGGHPSHVQIPNSHEVTAHYAGAPETAGFGHGDEPCFLEVELEGGGRESGVRVTPVTSGSLTYMQRDFDCSGVRSPAQLADTLAGIGRGAQGNRIARIRLTGRRPLTAPLDLPAIEREAGPQFVHLELLDDTEPPEDFEQLARGHGSLALFTDRLNREIAGTADAGRVRMLRRARSLGIEAYRAPRPDREDAR